MDFVIAFLFLILLILAVILIGVKAYFVDKRGENPEPIEYLKRPAKSGESFNP